MLTFQWHNKDYESGLPYDFTIQDINANVMYLDVKTTGYNFSQKMIFSSQEIKFIATKPNTYYIYRVYKTEGERYFLRICDNCKALSSSINVQTEMYSKNLEEVNVELKSAKFAISPNMNKLNFKSEIELVLDD